jgi:hypothetical protein
MTGKPAEILIKHVPNTNSSHSLQRFCVAVRITTTTITTTTTTTTTTIRINDLGNQISHSSNQHGIQFRPAKRVFCDFSRLSYYVLGKYWKRKYREAGHNGSHLFFPINYLNHRSILRVYNRSAWKADDQSRTWKETFLFCVKTLSQQLHGETENKDENMSL